jgi:hypothetical protein
MLTTGRPTAPRFKRLTPAEMAAKRERGECYNCTEKFTREHLKGCPVKGVFLLQMEEDDLSMEETEADPLISLNAITGISQAETLQLPVTLAGATILALIDSGSTHSFISVTVVCRLNLHPSPRPGLNVAVANGDCIASDGVCSNTHVVIGTEDFIIDLYVIPLDGYDMVLDVHWLRTLGPILWDFDRARLSCWRDDHQVVWQGIPRRRSKAAVHSLSSTDLMPLLVQEFDEVFATPTGLPPPRQFSHWIHLLPGTPPVVVRPYRYPQLLKDELER